MNIEDWVVVQAHGLTLIGDLCRPSGEMRILSPVYTLQPQMAAGAQGLQIGHIVTPVWLLGVAENSLPADAIVVPLSEFTGPQQARLRRGVEQAEAMQADFRREGSRVDIVDASALQRLVKR